MNSFREIIKTWPTSDALAKDIGVEQQTVQKWKERDNIPGRYWFDIHNASHLRNSHISLLEMARAAARGK